VFSDEHNWKEIYAHAIHTFEAAKYVLQYAFCYFVLCWHTARNRLMKVSLKDRGVKVFQTVLIGVYVSG